MIGKAYKNKIKNLDAEEVAKQLRLASTVADYKIEKLEQTRDSVFNNSIVESIHLKMNYQKIGRNKSKW